MINLIIEGVFYVITKLFDLIFSPVLNVLFSLFPNLGTASIKIYDFILLALDNVGVVLDIFLVPKDAIIFLFDYFVILYTIFILIRGVRFALNIYNKFKI